MSDFFSIFHPGMQYVREQRNFEKARFAEAPDGAPGTEESSIDIDAGRATIIVQPSASADTIAGMTPLVTVAELRSLMDAGAAPRILDVRWTLQQPDGRAEHAESHLPGAVYVDLDTELSTHGAPADGRHPLPSRETLQRAARRWGLRTGEAVVVHDAGPGIAAARAWWLLRHAGLTDVRILDGGLAAWRVAGGATQSGEVRPEPGDVELSWGHMPVVDLDEAADLPGHGILLDVRAPERYRGDVEPMDPIAGHIPGAVNAPNLDLLDTDGRFLPAAKIRDRLAGLDIDDDTTVAAYCGSGVNAAHAVAALEVAGIRAALYPGSWSQWSNTPGAPVATGHDL